MDMKITVALIGAATALAVAFFGLLKIFVVAKNTHKFSRDLEILKHTLDQQASNTRLEQEQLNKSLEAIFKAINAIQRMKDETELIVESVPGSLDSEAAVQAISKAREHLWEEFESQVGILDGTATKSFHKAKTTALRINRLVQEMTKGSSDSFALTGEQKHRLLVERALLTEHQQELRDAREQNILKRVLKYA